MLTKDTAPRPQLLSSDAYMTDGLELRSTAVTPEHFQPKDDDRGAHDCRPEYCPQGDKRLIPARREAGDHSSRRIGHDAISNRLVIGQGGDETGGGSFLRQPRLAEAGDDSGVPQGADLRRHGGIKIFAGPQARDA